MLDRVVDSAKIAALQTGVNVDGRRDGIMGHHQRDTRLGYMRQRPEQFRAFLWAAGDAGIDRNRFQFVDAAQLRLGGLNVDQVGHAVAGIQPVTGCDLPASGQGA
ncbi:hypothetical protein GALL_554370 [mine drainage metagenome]|uniref:Uncharacterized protein n=1 Tax=mine drainage metagenome TaxID=410659 RepID=A0A1J5PHJ4_9ZZZZ